MQGLPSLTTFTSVLLGPAVVWAAPFISEVSIASRTVPAGPTIPAYLELSGLAGYGAVDVVITNARTGPSFGQVLEVIHVPTGPDVRLVSISTSPASAWPPDVYPNPDPLPGLLTHHVLETAFPFSGSRSVLLMSGPTNLTPLGGSLANQAGNFQGAAVLDVLTFGPASVTLPHPNDPLSLIQWLGPSDNAITAPNNEHNQPFQFPNLRYMVGSTTALSLTLTGYAYDLNPGQANIPYTPAANNPTSEHQHPEPSGGSALAVLITALLARRRPI